MSKYGIWLSFNNQEEGFRIPVNPPSIEVVSGGKGKTYDITDLGEINVIKSPKLQEISFDSEFPAVRYPFVVGDTLLEPRQYIEYIEKWKESKRPVRFVFTGATVDINLPVSIESFPWKEVAGTPGDIQYSLKLKKYVFYAARRVTVKSNPQNAAAPVLQKEAPKRPDDRIPPQTYRLIAGDNLIKVAKKTLGDDSKWREIQKLNNISDAELKKLPVGMELKLPQVKTYA